MSIRVTRFHTPKERKLIEEVENQIEIVKDMGEVVFGTDSTIQQLQREKVQLVLIAKFGKKGLIERVKYFCKLSKTPFLMFPGDVRELGDACGRPHIVSAVSILDPGSSEILELREQSVE